MNQEDAMLGDGMRCGRPSRACYDVRFEGESLDRRARKVKRMIE